MPINVVILAAGQGKRMYSRLPKVLHLLAGRPLISHVIATARALGAGRICVVYGHGGEQVPQTVKSPDIVFAKQSRNSAPAMRGGRRCPLGKSSTTLVLYGDVPLVRPETLRAMITGSGERVMVLTAEPENPVGYGRIVRDKKGGVAKIVEEKDASATQRKIREVNTGIMALPTARLAGWLARLKNHNAQGEYYLTDVVALALADGVAVATVGTTDAWEMLGVNSKTQLAQLERIYQWQYATRLLEQGVTLTDPMRFDVRGELQCGTDVRIDVNCVFEGEVKLGDAAEIGANCILKHVEVGAGTRIEPFTHIDDATIGAGCRVGPYARIRPGTRLGEDVHIGNFVEIKASDIAAHSKANHLTYVGDSTVGRNVNIGAGTITCNYDGANKHRVIEDDGSPRCALAPVTAGKGATIVPAHHYHDAPPGELTFARRTGHQTGLETAQEERET